MDWKNKPYPIFNKIKQQMFAKGVENFSYVDKCVQDFDPQRTGKLTPHAFNLFTNKIGVFLTTQQIRNIKDVYGKDELICYKELLDDVKWSFPEKIPNLIDTAFDKLDPERVGAVNLSVLLDKYCARRHPLVLNRRKSPQQVYQAFATGISRKAVNEIVSKQAFVEYYAEINFCVPNERETYFADLIKGTWELTNPDEYVSPQRLREVELILYEKVRQKSNGKTNQWKCAKKAISYFDLGDEKCCDLNTFGKSLDKFGCNFKPHEIKALFVKYDVDNSGRLDYQEFSKMLMNIDINGMESKPNLLKTLGTNYFKITH